MAGGRGSRRSMLALCLVGSLCWSTGSTGCGFRPTPKPGLKVSGTILRDGQPLPLDPARVAAAADYVQVTFQRLDEKNTVVFSDSTMTNPEGGFSIKGLEPGTYRICVEQMTGGSDKLGGRFTTKSPIKREIEADTTDLTIELADFLKKK